MFPNRWPIIRTGVLMILTVVKADEQLSIASLVKVIEFTCKHSIGIELDA
jgi:hypothetical protein